MTDCGRVLVAGCGDLGTRLALGLVEDGHEVFGLRRDASSLPEPIRPISLDLASDPSGWSLPSDLRFVVQAAAPSGGSDDDYRAVYVDGLTHLLHALDGSGQRPEKVVVTTSTGVYGQTDGEWVDESSPTEPTHWSGRRLLEAEAILRSSDLAWVSLRIAGIYGPGRTRLIDLVRSGRATHPADRPAWTNRVHVDDAAAATRCVLLEPRAEGPVIAVDDEPARRRDVLRWLADRLGVDPPNAEQDESGDSGSRRSRSDKRCSNARLRGLGWSPRFPTYREGYASMLD